MKRKRGGRVVGAGGVDKVHSLTYTHGVACDRLYPQGDPVGSLQAAC